MDNPTPLREQPLTDADLRDWINNGKASHIKLTREDVQGLLKELLSHRDHKLSPCWRVWVPDDTPQGWHWIAAFPTQERALEYRGDGIDKDWLVLFWNEQPCLTGRA